MMPALVSILTVWAVFCALLVWCLCLVAKADEQEEEALARLEADIGRGAP